MRIQFMPSPEKAENDGQTANTVQDFSLACRLCGKFALVVISLNRPKEVA
jgi:hypothetical protein